MHVLDHVALSAAWSVPAHLVRRPNGAPGRVTAGAVPWEQRTLRRVVGLRAQPESAQTAAVLASETCAAWPVADLRSAAVQCAAALMTGAVTATGGRDVYLVLSVAGSCLVIEVCDLDARWPPGDGRWDAARALAAQAGGEFGLVCGPGGRGVFVALPLAPQPVQALDEWALETVTDMAGGSR